MKLDRITKKRLADMASFEKISQDALIERLIDEAYFKHFEFTDAHMAGLAVVLKDFSINQPPGATQ
jgi:hypothetical protein